jgi:hypothetical protein
MAENAVQCCTISQSTHPTIEWGDGLLNNYTLESTSFGFNYGESGYLFDVLSDKSLLAENSQADCKIQPLRLSSKPLFVVPI